MTNCSFLTVATRMLRNDGQLEIVDQIAVCAAVICAATICSSLIRWNRAVGYDSEMLLTWQPPRSYFLLCPTYHAFPASAPSNTALPEVLTGVPMWPVL